jgi:Fe-S cluster assembly protein SufD
MTEQIIDHIINLNNSAASGERQQLAQDWLKQNGIPDRKNEAWKYTAPLKFLTLPLSRPLHQVSPQVQALSPFKVFFKDGEPDLSRTKLPQGISLSPNVSNSFEREPNFAKAISDANAQIGATLKITAKTICQEPIVIVHENEIAPQIFIDIGELAQVCLVESFGPDQSAQGLCSPSTWLNLASGAQVEYVKVVHASHTHSHIANTKATLARDAALNSFTFACGAKLMRQELDIHLSDTGAHANAHGLFALRGQQHADQHVSLYHHAPHTSSDQLFKMILDEESRGVFTGRLEIAQDAQKVDASQLNKNLVLSKKAHVDTRPQLMVHADDVKCAHGATVGQLSGEEVFYLQSRGLSLSKAQKILCHAFAFDALTHLKHSDVRTWVSQLLFDNFEQFALEKFE